MKINKVLFVVSLMIVMMSCLSTISASYNENMNLMSHADSISMNINEQSTEFDDYNNLLVSENNDASIESHDYHDLIGNDDENSNDDSDDNEDEDEDSDEDLDEEDDFEDEDDDSDEDLDDEDESFEEEFIHYTLWNKFKYNETYLYK